MSELKSTWVEQVTYEWLQADEPRVLVHRGGTRSGKTYNACIAWAEYLSEVPGERLSIVRKTLPALKASVLKDLIDVLDKMGLYNPEHHHKQDKEITLPSGSIIDYFPTDDEKKVRGRSRDHLWANEANEIPAEPWRQLVLRTRGRIMLDFNPSHGDRHWIVKRYEGSPNARWYTSTYRDNPFLGSALIREIEAMKERDRWGWKVYGLGQRAQPATSIYREIGVLPSKPDGGVYGLDFGYNDPMALALVRRRDTVPKPTLDVWCLLHASYLTTSDLIDRMDDLGVSHRRSIYCDAAEPDRIEQIRRAGYQAQAAKKGQGSVKAGIDWMKQHRLCIGGPAAEPARREFRTYRWRTDASGQPTDTPVDTDDHMPDAARYASYSHYHRENRWLLS